MHYIIWTSSKGCKDIYTITDTKDTAEAIVDILNEWLKEHGMKSRAYATTCEDGRPYYHKEIKF